MILMGSLLAVLFTACDNDDDDNNTNQLNSQDQTFMAQAAMNNRAEIRAGQIASTRGNTAMVRSFGQQMVTEHTQAQSQLMSISSSTGYAVMDTIDAAHQQLMTQLNSLSGRAFDSVYIRSQVTDHQNAMTLFQAEISSGQHQQVKSYATTYLPIITMHHHKADSIRQRL